MNTSLVGETLTFSFPGDVGIIPTVRKFVADVLVAHNFSSRYIYRSEIVIDEVCHNAIMHGCHKVDAEIVLIMHINEAGVEFFVQDEGGRTTDLQRLKKAIDKPKTIAAKSVDGKIGLEIVKMFSEEFDFHVGDDNLTSVRIMRKREDSELIQQGV